jgi:hypothetical protein
VQMGGLGPSAWPRRSRAQGAGVICRCDMQDRWGAGARGARGARQDAG